MRQLSCDGVTWSAVRVLGGARTLSFVSVLICAGGLWAGDDSDLEFEGWRPFAPREELRPEFAVLPGGGSRGPGGLVIRHDSRDGLDGAWQRTFAVRGAQHYRLTASWRVTDVTHPRYQVYAEILFHDDKGQLVPDERLGVKSRPLFAREVASSDSHWRVFRDIFRAPLAATQATVQLHLRYAPGGQIQWSDVSLVPSGPPPERKVRLAAANYRPRGGKTAADNLQQLEPHVARAAELNADLVVLGECITSVGNGLTYAESAEPVPGPSTRFLGQLARRHQLYLVTTIHERVKHLIYNTAVLIGPDGELVGTYRKVCPARDEYRGGVMPGHDFPVFDTPLGKIGMMICFDVHVPEVARGLAANGAEIIALPIMGGDPSLARARAIENQVYLVTSTYSINDDWMQSGVWGLDGNLLVHATQPDTVVVAEIDLADRHFWRANMGEYRGRLRHERPIARLPD